MKELLRSFFKTTEDRIKNPFVGAFMTSWLLFNWKPLFFLLFGTHKAEMKIIYVQQNFSNVFHLLLFPLCSALFYVLVLPYFNWMLDELLQYSLIRRNRISIWKKMQQFENEEQLAIASIRVEEAKIQFRERNSHNTLVDELQKKNVILENEIKDQKVQNAKALESVNNQLKEERQSINAERRNFADHIQQLNSRINELADQTNIKGMGLQHGTSDNRQKNFDTGEVDELFVLSLIRDIIITHQIAYEDLSTEKAMLLISYELGNKTGRFFNGRKIMDLISEYKSKYTRTE